ncbi:hypothetical protein [Curtobacterium sp. VKM Ac-1395]|uniref:hypothetical protein n=1 Tax=Curtobacterium sp. VKM Ac-1395 TaxID=2783815 RepID=UPI00188A67E7|nr:hypothetical protein [Curtobacterium sp. VKM Ac-1395]MBF4592123.1 hypothetical protein [Curtobacterium sp. VKM Ac-1395]
MSAIARTLDHVIRAPARLARTTEFFFRRADSMGDIYPDDNRHGTVPGSDVDRVLFLGEAGQMSLGVRTHQLSMAAYFARHHHAASGRGVEWSIEPFPNARLADAPSVLAASEDAIRRADIVVVVVGITDALRVVRPAIWEEGIRDTLSTLTTMLAADARILLAHIPPLDNAGSLSRPARVAAGRHGSALNRRTDIAAEDHSQAVCVSFPEELTRALWRPESDQKRYSNTYDIWAAHMARNLPDPN